EPVYRFNEERKTNPSAAPSTGTSEPHRGLAERPRDDRWSQPTRRWLPVAGAVPKQDSGEILTAGITRHGLKLDFPRLTAADPQLWLDQDLIGGAPRDWGESPIRPPAFGYRGGRGQGHEGMGEVGGSWGTQGDNG